MQLFLEIMISTGLVSLPNLQDYWKKKLIFSQPGIVKNMPRNRFEQLCGRLHFNDNRQAHPHGTPEYNKIRPVLDEICHKSKRLYNPGQKLSC